MSETFIYGFEFDPALCDHIIDVFDNSPDVNYDDYREYHRLSSERLDQHTKDSIYSVVCNEITKYRHMWLYCASGCSESITEFNVQKFEPTHHYKMWHIEDGGPDPKRPQRKLVWMMYLNDVMEGGETQFLHQNKAYKPRKGTGLIWPAGWTHPHRGQAAPNETKYICTGWTVYSEGGHRHLPTQLEVGHGSDRERNIINVQEAGV